MRGVLRRCRWLGPVAVGTACARPGAKARAAAGRRPPRATPAPSPRAGGPGARLLGPRAGARRTSFLRDLFHLCTGDRDSGSSILKLVIPRVSVPWGWALGVSPHRWDKSVGRGLGPWGPRPPRAARASPSIAQLYRAHLHDSRLRVRRAVSCSLVNVIKQLLCQTRALFLKSPAESSPCVGTTRRNDIAIGTRIPRV